MNDALTSVRDELEALMSVYDKHIIQRLIFVFGVAIQMSIRRSLNFVHTIEKTVHNIHWAVQMLLYSIEPFKCTVFAVSVPYTQLIRKCVCPQIVGP